MSSKKLKNEKITTKVNPETGELIQITEEKTFLIRVKQDEFFMTYFKNLSGLFSLTSAKEILLMVKLCTLAEYNTGEIYLTAERRKTLCHELEIDKSYLSICLKKLKEKRLISGDRNDFKVNPNVFWKGSNQERNKFIKNSGLKLNIEFVEE